MDRLNIVKAFVIDNFLFGEGNIADDTRLFDSQIIDSTGILELVAFLEERFDIKVHDEEMLPENFSTPRNITGFILRKTKDEADLPLQAEG